MHADDVKALGALAGTAMAATTARVEELHDAILRRSLTGTQATSVATIHDGIAKPVYRSVRAATGALGRAAGLALAQTREPGAAPLADSRRGALMLGALNGLWGDRLEQDGGSLTPHMALRLRGSDVALDRDSLRAAYPQATPRLAVFVHGWCETEGSWELFGRRPDAPAGTPARTYGSRLEEDLGITPLWLRYNSGLHISENGRRLSALLDEAIAAWPVGVEQVVLIGHSMGGLVLRSACHYGHAEGASWTERVRHVFCLASPHLGSGVERAANAAGWALGRVPETRPLAALLNARSSGVKDLRYGYVVDEDWDGRDPDALLEDHSNEIPFLPGANHYFVAATLARDPDSHLARVVGDLLVGFPSASGHDPRGRHLAFPVDNGHHVPGLNHFHVLNHPAVYEQLHAWLERDAVGVEAVAATSGEVPATVVPAQDPDG
jgi:hypothetical protein